jgi:hypothetical protein
MNLAPPSELDASPSTSTVSITVLSVTPAHAKKLFAFASVELDIDGVQIEVHGIRAMREPDGTAIELPKFRDAGGVWQTAIHSAGRSSLADRQSGARRARQARLGLETPDAMTAGCAGLAEKKRRIRWILEISAVRILNSACRS